jgi:hypothetical protein
MTARPEGFRNHGEEIAAALSERDATGDSGEDAEPMDSAECGACGGEGCEACADTGAEARRDELANAPLR